jgi:xylulose-5-phosphate/fructose-6-phosphate phosphoketolase
MVTPPAPHHTRLHASIYVDRVPKLGAAAAYVKQAMRDRLTEHHYYIRVHGADMPIVADWRWPGKQ